MHITKTIPLTPSFSANHCSLPPTFFPSSCYLTGPCTLVNTRCPSLHQSACYAPSAPHPTDPLIPLPPPHSTLPPVLTTFPPPPLHTCSSTYYLSQCLNTALSTSTLLLHPPPIPHWPHLLASIPPLLPPLRPSSHFTLASPADQQRPPPDPQTHGAPGWWTCPGCGTCLLLTVMPLWRGAGGGRRRERH